MHCSTSFSRKTDASFWPREIAREAAAVVDVANTYADDAVLWDVPTIITTVERMGEAIGEVPDQAISAACADAVRAPGGTTKGWDLVRPAVLPGRLVIEAGFDV